MNLKKWIYLKFGILGCLIFSCFIFEANCQCTILVGASLTWDISRSFNSTPATRQIRFFLRSAFDVTACTSPCIFTVGSNPASFCGDVFGQICVRRNPAQTRSCSYNAATDPCSFAWKNSNLTVVATYDDLNAVPITGKPPNEYDDATSIGARKFIYGETYFTYSVIPYNISDRWLEAWFSYSSGSVIVPNSKLVLSLALPITNFYSPVPWLPLFIPVPFNGINVQLKSYDYDGQPMIVSSVGSDYTTSTSVLLYSDSAARTVTVSSCCQCPLPSAINPNAFYDLGTEPNGFVGPAPSALYDGPVLGNRSAVASSVTSTIDALTTTSAVFAQRVQVADAIFARLWQAPGKPAGMGDAEAGDQQATTSTTVETYVQMSLNPSTCGPANTPHFLSPTVTEVTCPYNQIGNSPCDEMTLLANGSSASQPVRIVPAVGFSFTDGEWLAAEQVTARSPPQYYLICTRR